MVKDTFERVLLSIYTYKMCIQEYWHYIYTFIAKCISKNQNFVFIPLFEFSVAYEILLYELLTIDKGWAQLLQILTYFDLVTICGTILCQVNVWCKITTIHYLRQIDDWSTLIQVAASCRQPKSHYLNNALCYYSMTVLGFFAPKGGVSLVKPLGPLLPAWFNLTACISNHMPDKLLGDICIHSQSL